MIYKVGTEFCLALWWLWQVEALWTTNTWMYWWVPNFFTNRTLLSVFCSLHRFSRKILWLRVAASNNNPRYISSYYIQCVCEIEGGSQISALQHRYNNYLYGLSGCPSILRTDAGSENSTLAFVQPILRHYHTDEFAQERSFRYGPSISNQVSEQVKGYIKSYKL